MSIGSPSYFHPEGLLFWLEKLRNLRVDSLRYRSSESASLLVESFRPNRRDVRGRVAFSAEKSEPCSTFSSNPLRSFRSPLELHPTEFMVVQAKRVLVPNPRADYAHKSDGKSTAGFQEKQVSIFLVRRCKLEGLSLRHLEFLCSVRHLHGASRGRGTFVGFGTWSSAGRRVGIGSVHVQGLNHLESVRTKHYIVSQTKASLEAVVLDPYPELFAFDLVASTHHVGQPFPSLLLHWFTIT